MSDFKSLPVHLIGNGATLLRPERVARKVRHDSPALDVMTDLARVVPAMMESGATMDAANQTMIRFGVRLLFVHDGTGALTGLITSTDILGEKPMRLVQERGVKHNEILVADLMTPLKLLEAVTLDDATHAQVGHIVATLERVGRQHLLVAESERDGKMAVRGIFSSAQIARQLGTAIRTSDAALNFSELVTRLE
jgi:CBS-domain-containing membrane protein